MLSFLNSTLTQGFKANPDSSEKLGLLPMKYDRAESKSFLNRFHALCLNDTGVFSDNYFNMLPGEKRKIQFIPSEKFNGSTKFDPRLEINSVLGLCSKVITLKEVL